MDRRVARLETAAANDDSTLTLPGAPHQVATELNSADEAALEAGIASVFDALLTSDAGQGEAAKERAEEIGVEPTFVLLAQLNRLWAQPLSA